MASKFKRRQTWWVKFHHPVTGVRIRESLETRDPTHAELLRQRIELEVAVREPRFGAAEMFGGAESIYPVQWRSEEEECRGRCKHRFLR